MSSKDALRILTPIGISLGAVGYSSLSATGWAAAIDAAQLPILATGAACALWSCASAIARRDPGQFSSCATLRLAAASRRGDK
jgi:hypothetical protein